MPDLGTKYECSNCGTKFYDLGKPEPICPKCGALYVAGEDSSSAASKAAKKRRKPEPVVRAVVEDEAPAEEIEFTPDDDVAGEPELDDEDLEEFGDVDEEEEDIDDDEP
jgi:uncharacterized protein (TIGR02300 family)